MKRIAALALALLIPSQLMAASGQPVIDGNLEPAGYTQIDDLDVARGLGTIPDGTKIVLIQAEGDDVRWRDDGVSPDAATGMLLAEDQTLVYNGNPRTFEVIEVSADGILNVTFYR